MILSIAHFFTTVEFYIILAVVAAAVVAMAGRPHQPGPVMEYLLPGRLQESDSPERELYVECLPDGSVCITRRRVEGVTDAGAVSVAIEVKGADLRIEERITPGKGIITPCLDAEFHLKFMRPGRYHIMYNSSSTGLFAAFPLHVIPGLKTTKALGL